MVVLLIAERACTRRIGSRPPATLYASAQYDEALEVLGRLSAGASSTDERQSIELYRTLCLFAVGRRDEADRAIEAIIARDPLYRPGDDLSPRTRTAFSDAKKRLLPAIVQQQYAEAKGAFDRREFEAAAAAFKRVIDALDDPDIGLAAQQPPLADLRTLAAGFHDLSVKSHSAATAAAAAAPVPMRQHRSRLAAEIYTGEEAGVRPPVTIAQELPQVSRDPCRRPASRASSKWSSTRQGKCSRLRWSCRCKPSVVGGRFVSVASSYHQMVLAAASRWRFEPATMNGVPVPFRKRVQIQVAPPTR